jgi:hypothetical protein
MISQMAYFLLWGKPLIMYGGILTYFFLIFTALAGYMRLRGIMLIPYKWHPRLAVLTIIVASIHALFGLAVFFGF